MKIGIANAAEVDQLWPSIAPLFSQAIERCGDDISTGYLWQSCRSGAAFLLIVSNEDAIGLALVFRFENWSKGSVVRILAAAGHDMEMWKALAFDHLANLARENGATRIITEGRKGWERVFPRARLLRCVYEMEID